MNPKQSTKPPHFWAFWGPEDWFFFLFMVLVIAGGIAMTTWVVVLAIRDPQAFRTPPPPPGTHQVCTTWFLPVSTGKSVILIPERTCHDEPNQPTK